MRGVTLFVADLSTRLPEKELTEYIPDLINTLLSNPTLDNIKTVCLVLKVSLDSCSFEAHVVCLVVWTESREVFQWKEREQLRINHEQVENNE